MYCNRRSLVFYDIIILLVIILLLSVMMNGCGFSHWSYQIFHLPYVAATCVDLTIPVLSFMEVGVITPLSNRWANASVILYANDRAGTVRIRLTAGHVMRKKDSAI